MLFALGGNRQPSQDLCHNVNCIRVVGAEVEDLDYGRTSLKNEAEAALPAGGQVLVETVVGSEETDAERVGKAAASGRDPVPRRLDTGRHSEQGHGCLGHLEAFEQAAVLE